MDLVQDLLDDVRLNDGRFGSVAAPQNHITLMAATEGKADVQIIKNYGLIDLN